MRNRVPSSDLHTKFLAVLTAFLLAFAARVLHAQADVARHQLTRRPGGETGTAPFDASVLPDYGVNSAGQREPFPAELTARWAGRSQSGLAVFADELRGPVVYEPAITGIGPRLTAHKRGFFQKLSLTSTWLDRGNSGDYGLTEIDLFARFAVPMPTTKSPLVITPTFNYRFVDGPANRDLPERLHEAFIDFTWLPSLTDRWSAIVGVAPSVYSDFEADQDEAFRWTGQGLAKYDWVPGRWQLIFGVLYLDRNDIRVLPAGGLIWTPNSNVHYEILFPNPKLAHRLDWGPSHEDWFYVAGEFGGNTWAIERAGGVPDTLTMHDLRLLIGLERKKDGGAGYRLEVGYVFGRRAEFESGLPDIEPADTVLVRIGAAF